ncbi:hypothetical protein [Rhodococcoides yunnanense]|uniref:hypothetical protein n=1 Tax=Rhodococcoides yunnanense TaxID=278209 RepID=UPI000934CA10|nr:hypothetical protein [Rhodococcus yunnanensis]
MTSPEDTITATVSVKPAWVNSWFHVLFTKPGLEVDGRGHELHWGDNDVEIPATAGRIGVYFHYRGRPAQRLALSERLLDHRIGSRVVARLGVRNSARFSIVEP